MYFFRYIFVESKKMYIFKFYKKECSKQIKETMDKRFGATWHCIIGQNFGFEVTHEQENLLYLFYQGNIAVLLFKC